MKKLLILLTLTMLFISCEENHIKEGTGWDTKIVNVRENEWELFSEDGGFNRIFVCTKRLNGLDNHIYEYGNVAAYLINNYGTNYESQTPIPYTDFFGSANGNKWGESVYFSYSPGEISFFFVYSDFDRYKHPAMMDFRVVLTWPY